MELTGRRAFIRTTAVGGGALLAAPMLWLPRGASAAQTSDDAKIFSKYFKLEVKGIENAVPGVTSVDPGRLTVTLEEVPKGSRPDYRAYTYGSHEYDDMTFTVQTGPGMVVLRQWMDEAINGDAPLRRDISLHLLARDKTTVLRTIDMFDCLPVEMNVRRKQTGFRLQVPGIMERPGMPAVNVSAKGNGNGKQEALRITVNGLEVPAVCWGGGVPLFMDPWTRDALASRQALCKADRRGNACDVPPAASDAPSTALNSVGELTVVSYVTPDSMVESDAAHAVANLGRNERFTITITELAKDKSVVKTFVYDNCLLTGMDFPSVDASGGEILMRTTTWKPEILTVS